MRLQQVVSAPSEKREDLLKELEHFAFRGIPNLTQQQVPMAAGATSPRVPSSGARSPAPASNNGEEYFEEEDEEQQVCFEKPISIFTFHFLGGSGETQSQFLPKKVMKKDIYRNSCCLNRESPRLENN